MIICFLESGLNSLILLNNLKIKRNKIVQKWWKILKWGMKLSKLIKIKINKILKWEKSILKNTGNISWFLCLYLYL